MWGVAAKHSPKWKRTDELSYSLFEVRDRNFWDEFCRKAPWKEGETSKTATQICFLKSPIKPAARTRVPCVHVAGGQGRGCGSLSMWCEAVAAPVGEQGDSSTRLIPSVKDLGCRGWGNSNTSLLCQRDCWKCLSQTWGEFWTIWIFKTWIWILALHLNTCVTLGKTFNLSGSQFFHL